MTNNVCTLLKSFLCLAYLLTGVDVRKILKEPSLFVISILRKIGLVLVLQVCGPPLSTTHI